MSGYKVKQNNEVVDTSSLIPQFPEGTNATLTCFNGSTTNNSIRYCTKYSDDSWVDEINVLSYVGDYYTPPAGTYKTIDPKTRVTFNKRLVHQHGEYGNSDIATGRNRWVYIYKQSNKIVIYSRYSSGSNIAAETATFSADDFPNKVLPDRLLCIFCGAGGSGTMSTQPDGIATATHGGGGGGGGTIAVVVKVPEEDGDTTKNFIYFNIAGGCGYLTSPITVPPYHVGRKGADSFFQIHDSSGQMKLQITAMGGFGGINKDVSVAVPNSGRQYDHTYYYGDGGYMYPRFFSVSGQWGYTSKWWWMGTVGGAGGKGSYPSNYTYQMTDAGNTSGSWYLTNNRSIRSLSAYNKSYSHNGGKGKSIYWGAGGGASAMGAGGDGAYDQSSRRFGNLPTDGFGGGGGGADGYNWGGASAPGAIDIYF